MTTVETLEEETQAHTPGPWTAAIEIARRIHCRTVTINGANGHAFLADVYDGNGAYPAEANARLIAAAPEMYDAIRLISDLRDAWRNNDLDSTEYMDELERIQLQDLIAKVKWN